MRSEPYICQSCGSEMEWDEDAEIYLCPNFICETASNNQQKINDDFEIGMDERNLH